MAARRVRGHGSRAAMERVRLQADQHQARPVGAVRSRLPRLRTVDPSSPRAPHPRHPPEMMPSQLADLLGQAPPTPPEQSRSLSNLLKIAPCLATLAHDSILAIRTCRTKPTISGPRTRWPLVSSLVAALTTDEWFAISDHAPIVA